MRAEGLTVASIGPDEIRALRLELGLDRCERARFSDLFMLRLYLGFHLPEYLDCYAVVREVEYLEGLRRSSATKPAAPFEREPLRGLWHKHYWSAQFMARNIRNEWQRPDGDGDWLLARVSEVFDPHMGELLTPEITGRLVESVIDGALKSRSGRLTGEWIVFAKHEGRNYYLDVASHAQDDGAIYSQIKRVCGQEFPELGLVEGSAA